jgi:hypothetical protein
VSPHCRARSMRSLLMKPCSSSCQCFEARCLCQTWKRMENGLLRWWFIELFPGETASRSRLADQMAMISRPLAKG